MVRGIEWAMGRPRVHKNDAARKAAYAARKRDEKRSSDVEVPVPREVLVERDYRQAIVEMMANQDPTCSLPPLGYAAGYYTKAWQMQRRFARG